MSPGRSRAAMPGKAPRKTQPPDESGLFHGGPAGAASRRRRSFPDLLAVLLVYAVTAIGTYVYASNILSGAPDFPEVAERLSLFLLGVLPAALSLIFIFKLRKLLIDWRKRRYGSRLRLRLSGLFLLATAAAAFPQGLFLFRLALAAQGSVASEDVRRGLSGGLGIVLDYYEEDQRRLEYAARRDLPALAEADLPDRPDLVLEALSAREPRMEAIEFFERGQSRAFAGDAAARLSAAPAAASPGYLPVSRSGGVGRLRYALPWGKAGGSIVLTIRLPENFDRAVGDLSKAGAQAELLAEFSPRWAKLLLLLYAFLVLPLFLLATLLGLDAAELVAEPLISIEEATRRVAAGELSLRILAKPGDETGRLIASFNSMLGEIERYREGDLRKGKFDAWKDIAQRLAHELKNPLTPIRLAAERLLRLSKTDPARALELLEPSTVAIVSEVEAMDSLLADFRAFASLPEPDRDWADLRGIVSDAVALFTASYPRVDFHCEGVPQGMTLRVDRAQIKRALSNLLHNAIDAMNGSGRIDIRADLVKTADSRYCRLLVKDDGQGVPVDIRDRIFAPYFTTKSTGTGLGLSIVERIIADHGGSIRFESEVGVGTSFYIDLPLARS